MSSVIVHKRVNKSRVQAPGRYCLDCNGRHPIDEVACRRRRYGVSHRYWSKVTCRKCLEKKERGDNVAK